MGSKSTSAWKRLFVGTSLLRRWLRVKLLNLLGPGGALLVPPAMRRLQELHLLTTPQRRNLQQRGRRGQTPSAWFLRNVYLYFVGMRIYCWALLGSKQFMCADFCTWLKLFGSLLTYLGQFYFFFNYHVTQSKKKNPCWAVSIRSVSNLLRFPSKTSMRNTIMPFLVSISFSSCR